METTTRADNTKPTVQNVITAIRQFLEYGEESFDPNREVLSKDKSHGGYYSGNGWPAVVLKKYLEVLQSDGSQRLKLSEEGTLELSNLQETIWHTLLEDIKLSTNIQLGTPEVRRIDRLLRERLALILQVEEIVTSASSKALTFPSPVYSSPNNPCVLVEKEQVLALYNEYNSTALTKVDNKVMNWFVVTAEQLHGWGAASFKGLQCLLVARS